MSISLLLRLTLILAVALTALATPAPAHASAPAQTDTPPPKAVTIPGTIQSKLGCPGDWQPACAKTYLTYDKTADLWIGAFDIPAGAYEYKVALNDGWGENYGGKADRNGPNVALKLDKAAKVTFVYDHKSHVVANSADNAMPIVLGSLQNELGCKTDDDKTCLNTYMTDPEFDGVYGFSTKNLPPGEYTARVMLFNKPDENLGEAGKLVTISVPSANAEVYFGFDVNKKELIVSTDGAPKGNIAKQKAYWVNRDTLLWNVTGSPKYSYELRVAQNADLKLGSKGVSGGQVYTLTYASGGPGGDVFKQFPHLMGYTALKLDEKAAADAATLLKGQIAITLRDDKGNALDSAGVQIAGAIDDVFAGAASQTALCVSWDGITPTLRVWAPTARSMAAHIFKDAATNDKVIVPMKLDEKSGVWSVTGDPDWKNKFYLLEVEVFSPRTGKVEKNLVTDPYSISLSANSKRSQFVDLRDKTLKPDGWDALKKPALDRVEDIVLYELHIRDFSIGDQTVTPTLRGKYGAFTQANSNGMKHLKALADAGLTHVHVLPAFDIATIEEDASKRAEPDVKMLKSYGPNSDKQTALVEQFNGKDGYNWGYDPYHFNTPEGSYATDPNGTARVVEFRQMVAGLSAIGLRTVMDVVYNHTSASGQDDKSVFDKIVPGYYYRLNKEGGVETSTCCQNTASENAMMEKFIIDSVLMWAKEYKVDGFRFDLMGHHMLGTMTKLRDSLDALTLEKDGMDGKKIYVYGEGWDFGEVAKNARGVNASQANLAGAGIGSFNDRLRDAVRGGSPFDAPTTQGFASGLALTPNAINKNAADIQQSKLAEYADWIKLGLAGNLKNFVVTRADGVTARGEQILYGGSPAAYAAAPRETINYVSAHDNETLYDKLAWALPANTSLSQRVRANNLALDVVMLAQGIPFFHAGDDILRSKSLDRDSYNSGDWFNVLDFSYAENGWGRGLPPSIKDRWAAAKPVLANAAIRPTSAAIKSANAHFREMLQVRKSSPLFRLGSADEVLKRVSFLNQGAGQKPGLIVMVMDGAGRSDVKEDKIVVIINASPSPQTFAADGFKNGAFALHPVLQKSADAVTRSSAYNAQAGAFSVPGRTTAVFVMGKK